MNRFIVAAMLFLSVPVLAHEKNSFFIKAFDGSFVCANIDALVLCDESQKAVFEDVNGVLRSSYGDLGEFAFETTEDSKVVIKSVKTNTYLRANIVTGVIDHVEAAYDWEKFEIVNATTFDRVKSMASKYRRQFINNLNEVVIPAARTKLEQLQAFWQAQTPETVAIVETAALMAAMTTFVVVGLKYTWPRA